MKADTHRIEKATSQAANGYRISALEARVKEPEKGAGYKLTGKIARMIFHDTVLTGQDLLDVRENLGRTYAVSYS